MENRCHSMFLHRHGTVVKKIAHDDIIKDIDRHQQKNNRQNLPQKAAETMKKMFNFQQHVSLLLSKTLPVNRTANLFDSGFRSIASHCRHVLTDGQ